MKKYSFILLLALLTCFAGISQIRIGTPALATPANNATNQFPDVFLNWDAVTGALNYRAQLATDNAFTDIILDSVTDLSAVQTGHLLFGQDYFWRVKAYGMSGDSSYWTPTRKFTIFTKVDLNTPNNNQADRDVNVSLKWKDKVANFTITGIEYYELQYDTVNTFDSPVLANRTVQGGLYEYKTTLLFFGTKYYWRVRAGHAAAVSSWSDVRAFTTLNTFTLRTPNDNSVGQDLNVQLRWDQVPGVKRYDYEFDESASFPNPIIYTTDTFRIAATDLLYGTKYYWRVRARHERDTSGWTVTRNFETQIAPVLKNPENAAIDLPLKPEFTWDPIRGSFSYEIMVADNQAFENPKVHEFTSEIAGQNPGFKTLYNLATNTMYYWRVRAAIEIDTSEWSEARTFTTQGPIGVNNIFMTAGINIYPNPSKGVLNLELTTGKASNLTISILDLVGKTIYSNKMEFYPGAYSQKICLQDFQNGIYILRIEKDGQIYTGKIILDK